MIDEITNLMLFLNQSGTLDAHRFSLLYNFVFFICCDEGQKKIAVKKAIDAWKLVLNGRFRLLDQWCAFLQGHCNKVVSKDTWELLLVFSSDMEPQPSTSSVYNGLKLHAGSKRSLPSADEQSEEILKDLEKSICSIHLSEYKKSKKVSTDSFLGYLDCDLVTVDSAFCTVMKINNSHECLHASSACAADSISKAFEGFFFGWHSFLMIHVFDSG